MGKRTRREKAHGNRQRAAIARPFNRPLRTEYPLKLFTPNIIVVVILGSQQEQFLGLYFTENYHDNFKIQSLNQLFFK